MSENDVEFWKMVQILGAIKTQIKVLGPENEDERRKLKAMLDYLKRQLEEVNS